MAEILAVKVSGHMITRGPG